METVSIVLAHPDVQKRIDIKKMLFHDQAMEVAAELEEPAECLASLREHQPDLFVLSLGLGTEEEVLNLVKQAAIEFPQLEILLLVPDMEATEQAQKLVRAGAYDYLVQPLEADELISAVKDIVSVSRQRQEKFSEIISGRSAGKTKRQGKVLSVFSTKGGVGRSLLAVNLACSFRKQTEKRVALVDLDLQFGDDAILMDMKPTTMIASLARDAKQEERVDAELLEDYMHTHEASGVELLSSPARPEEAEYVEADDVRKILQSLRRHYDYVIIDTSSHISDSVMAAVEESDIILLLLTLELPTIKNGKLMLDLMDSLGLSRENVRILMNRDVPDSELQVEEVEEALEEKMIGRLPSQGAVVMPSIDEGTPVVLSHPEAEFSQELFELTKNIVRDYFDREEDLVEEEEEESSVQAGELPTLDRRLFAGLIDRGLLFLVFVVLASLSVFSFQFLGGPLGTLVGIFSLFLCPLTAGGYYTYFNLSGQSPGKAMMNLKLIIPDQESIPLGVAFIRTLGLFLSMFPFGLGYLWALWDEKQQTWHDKLAGTIVVSTGEE